VGPIHEDNSIRRALRKGGPRWDRAKRVRVARCRGSSRPPAFDYCMIDHEHGAFDLETIADLARAGFRPRRLGDRGIHKSQHLTRRSRQHGSWAPGIGRRYRRGSAGDRAEARSRSASRGIAGAGCTPGTGYGARHATSMRRGPMEIRLRVDRGRRGPGEWSEAIAAIEGIDMIRLRYRTSVRASASSPARAPTFKAACVE